MALLSHFIYEIRKGVRKLAMVTVPRANLVLVIARLERAGIAHLVLENAGPQVNVLMGAGECVDAVRSFGVVNLSRLTPEQDFVLGALLGYDLEQQCRRYLGKVSRREVA